MSGVKEHYDNLLAPYYSWICGGSDLKLKENRAFFHDHNVHPERSAAAVDLGAGCGFQSIPLAESGFNVTAIDVSRDLLAELRKNAEGLPIVTIEDNLLNFTEHSPAKIEIIVCMGDTLTHLNSRDEVRKLINTVYPVLEEQGLFILGFRDLTTELTELDRFITVKSDSKRIFTCFLEFEKKQVKVHDILYEAADNKWNIKKSFYRKLRISEQWTNECLRDAGFTIEKCDNQNGMLTILARKR
jgi:ubiquinone/menaquinone biosynthesis C-methylase UbiE